MSGWVPDSWRIVLGCGLALLLARPLQAQTGPLAAYAMSNGNDSSGNNRTATLANTASAPGKYQDAQRFNGSNARMFVPAMPIASAFTLEAWVNFGQMTAAATATVVGPRAAQQAAPRAAPVGWQIAVYQSSDNLVLVETGGILLGGFTGTDGAFRQVRNPAPMQPNTWYHVAVAYNGSTLTLFTNGAQTASVPATGTVKPSTQAIEMGGSQVDQGWMLGLIDDVRIYNRGLTVAEVAADAASPIDVVREPVVSWDMEVWPRGANPDTAGVPLASGNFPKSSAACNQAPAPPVTGTLQNPTHARVEDPDVPGRECEITVASMVNIVAVGTGYFMTARAKGATTLSTRSTASNAFDRVATAVPPNQPKPPLLVKK